MSTIDWPSAIQPSAWDWGIRKAGVQFSSPFNGTGQAIDYVAERWVLTITLPPRRQGQPAGAVRALLNFLAGGVNRVRVWDMGSGTKARPGEPVGTMRGTPTLSITAARGNDSLVLSATPGSTLLTGDMIGLGAQVFQVRADCITSGLGVLTVPVVNRVRGPIASGTAVVWNRPTVEMAMPSMTARHAQGSTHLLSAQIDLEERW